MKYILILTQDENNLSVKMLAHSLKQQSHQVLVCDIKHVSLSSNTLKFLGNSSIGIEIPFSEIALVVKRTWGPARKKVLEYCQHLEKNGVTILNGCDFIKWSHSKVEQYKSLATQNIFPKTVCFKEPADIDYKELAFPLVFKTNEGTRGDGVYLIESVKALEELLKELEQMKSTEFKSGFLLQAFVPTDSDKDISNYYRVNIVDGRVQSAVQFQLKWTVGENVSYKKLSDFKGAEDKPIDLAGLNNNQLNKIVSACPAKQGVVGIDVVQDNAGNLFLLEYNDGPVVSLIVELGKKYNNKACEDFPDEIAKLCFKLIKEQQLNLSLRSKL